MGSTASSFVDNIPIVWVVKKLLVLDNPIIFFPKQGPPPREIPLGQPPTYVE